MASKDLPSPEVLRQLLRYEPDTGKLFWRERGPEWFDGSLHHQRKWNGRFAGAECFRASGKFGHRYGTILARKYRAHRIAWAIATGRWPESEIDHINCVPHDNRLCNLREASRSENQRNTPIRRNNTSGAKGVSWSRGMRKWHVYIAKDRKRTTVGYFVDLEEASKAYAKASAELHGEFGRTS